MRAARPLLVTFDLAASGVPVSTQASGAWGCETYLQVRHPSRERTYRLPEPGMGRAVVMVASSKLVIVPLQDD